MRCVRRLALFCLALGCPTACSAFTEAPESESWNYALTIPPFAVPAGKEVQRCYYMKFPSDLDVDVSALRLENQRGSHHYQVYVNDEDLPDGSEECFRVVDFNRWHMIFATQTETMTWQLPERVGIRLKAHQQMMIQTHYINTGVLRTPSGIGGGTLRFRRAEAGAIDTHLGVIFGINHDIHLPPNARSQASARCPFDKDVTIAAVTGHFHFHGESFEARIGTETNMGSAFYTVDGFPEPPFATYQNSQAPTIARGEAVDWRCTYMNTEPHEITFGAHETTHEHCNMFLFYYPAAPQEFRDCTKSDRDGVDTEE
jgi:hypothetical protein